MKVIRCYNKAFAIKGTCEILLEPWLLKRGLSLKETSQKVDTLLEFRFEQAGSLVNLYIQEELSISQQPFELAAEVVLARVHANVAFYTPDLAFIRADSVQKKDGSGLLIAGGTFSGKSFLASHLRKNGAKSWSSHYTVINDRGELLPYPATERPLSGIQASTLAALTYKPSSEWSVHKLSPGEMALRLTSFLDGKEDCVAPALPKIAQLCATADQRISGVRGEADEAALSLLSYQTNH